MLKFRRRTPAPVVQPGADLADRPELQIRDLLDDPALRRAMGLADAESRNDVPTPRFDRRRLLDQAAA